VSAARWQGVGATELSERGGAAADTATELLEKASTDAVELLERRQCGVIRLKRIYNI
jgi:hypothetical protein